MFTGISWQSYLLMVVAASAVYYFYIAVRYFRSDLELWITSKTSRRPAVRAVAITQVSNGVGQAESIPPMSETSDADDSEYDELEHLIGRVQKTISDAATRNAKPDEVKSYLALVFKEYPSLKNDGMRPAINELVASECTKQDIPISEDGVLTYEVVNLIAACQDAFEAFDFSEETHDDRHLRYAIIAQVHDYLL